MKKILILIIILIILFGLYLVYNYFTQPIVKAPTTAGEFQGPTSPPSIKGPSSPSPNQ